MNLKQEVWAFLSGLALAVLIATLVSAYLISHPPSVYEETYAQKACAQQHSSYAAPKLGWFAYQKNAARNNKAQSTPKGDIGEKPDWCDLAAQESMAESTASIEWATWAMTGLTLLGVVAIGFTLYFTRETLREAGKTTNAAIRGADFARVANKIMRDEQRPWVSVTVSIRDGLTIDKDTGHLGIAFIVEVRNIGRSIAKNMQINFYNELIQVVDEFNVDPQFSPHRSKINLLPEQREIIHHNWVHELEQKTGIIYPILHVKVRYSGEEEGSDWYSQCAFAVYHLNKNNRLPPIEVEQGNIGSEALYVQMEKSDAN